MVLIGQPPFVTPPKRFGLEVCREYPDGEKCGVWGTSNENVPRAPGSRCLVLEDIDITCAITCRGDEDFFLVDEEVDEEVDGGYFSVAGSPSEDKILSTELEGEFSVTDEEKG